MAHMFLITAVNFTKAQTKHQTSIWQWQKLGRLSGGWGNIIRTVSYIANVLPLQWAQLTETVHTAQLGLEFVFLVILCWRFICMFLHVLFYLEQLNHFPFCLALM